MNASACTPCAAARPRSNHCCDNLTTHGQLNPSKGNHEQLFSERWNFVTSRSIKCSVNAGTCPMNLDVAKALANDFNTSLTAAAIKLAKRATAPACIVCHNQSRLLWHQRNGTFPSELFVLGELHQDTDAFGIAFGAAAGLSRPRKEPADRWLSGGGAYRLTIESQSIKLPDSTVLTMLSLCK